MQNMITYVLADFVCLNAEVSANELHRNIDATRGFLLVFSANFCARNPPSEAPKQCIYIRTGLIKLTVDHIPNFIQS